MAPEPLATLTFAAWRRFDLAAATRIAAQVASTAGGRLDRVEAVEHLGAPLHRVLVERGGRMFALIPGGRVTVGFDVAAWQPSAELLARYREESASQGFGDEDLRAHLARVLSPLRAATVPTLLMAVEDEPIDEAPAAMPAVLAREGLRLPTPDEWEHACGAGARTLFRWGDECPLDRIPYGDDAGPHARPNAFGLRIAHDTYRSEITSEPGLIHGGDGGESVCGGYGTVLAWLPLATANRHPDLAELVYGEDGEDLVDCLSTRPVLDLR
ncbi:hypothetical protein ACFP3U_02555 [Kitasatospora misakiensis]|uniref:Sulfatase-modifying factor enzyme domain-containing protein n=1 Tax=Kitasatospora misakiensis TaxID=67330 RepID=A0ABW0WUB3_9ACTN